MWGKIRRSVGDAREWRKADGRWTSFNAGGGGSRDCPARVEKNRELGEAHLTGGAPKKPPESEFVHVIGVV